MKSAARSLDQLRNGGAETREGIPADVTPEVPDG